MKTCADCNGTGNVEIEGHMYECTMCKNSNNEVDDIKVMINTIEAVRERNILNGDWLGAGALGDVINKLSNINPEKREQK